MHHAPAPTTACTGKGQDRTGQDRTGQDRTGQDRTGQDRTGQDRTGQDRKAGQVRHAHMCQSRAATRDLEGSVRGGAW
jgi:hypothetical protein